MTTNAIPLSELEAEFLRWDGDPTTHRTDQPRERANGISFLCPLCFQRNNGPVGTHGIICWDPSVPLPPKGPTPAPGRWNLVGRGLDDLTLVAGSSSILLTSGCRWHGWIRDGKAVW